MSGLDWSTFEGERQCGLQANVELNTAAFRMKSRRVNLLFMMIPIVENGFLSEL
jgi:hypothetical protein